MQKGDGVTVIVTVVIRGTLMLPPLIRVEGYNVPNPWLEMPGGGERKEYLCRSWGEARQGSTHGHIVDKFQGVFLGLENRVCLNNPTETRRYVLFVRSG